VAPESELLEQPVRRRPSGGRCAFHQRHRQVDPDAVTGQRQAIVRSVDGRATGEIAGPEPWAVVSAQQSLAHDGRSFRLRVQLV